jgi:hypothetical protein
MHESAGAAGRGRRGSGEILGGLQEYAGRLAQAGLGQLLDFGGVLGWGLNSDPYHDAELDCSHISALNEDILHKKASRSFLRNFKQSRRLSNGHTVVSRFRA